MRKNQKYHKEKMFAGIEQCQREGISLKEFFQQAGIPYSAWQYWLRKYRSEQIMQNLGAGHSFLPVHIEDNPEPGQNQLTIRYPNGIQISCPYSTPAHLLQALIIR